jgi:hypothetical protein
MSSYKNYSPSQGNLGIFNAMKLKILGQKIGAKWLPVMAIAAVAGFKKLTNEAPTATQFPITHISVNAASDTTRYTALTPDEAGSIYANSQGALDVFRANHAQDSIVLMSVNAQGQRFSILESDGTEQKTSTFYSPDAIQKMGLGTLTPPTP